MRFWILVLAGLALSSGAVAQTKAQPPSASVDQPSARQMALSRRYVELMQNDQLEDLIRAGIEMEADSDPDAYDLPTEDREFLIDLAAELTTDIMPQMMDQLVPIYARTFTEAELESLVAFYDSEMGRSIVAKTYTSMPEANAAMMTVMPRMYEKMATRMCAHYGCDPDEMLREWGMGGRSEGSPPIPVAPSRK